MKKEKLSSVCQWIPIADFDGEIKLKSGEKISMIEVKPINFRLKSDTEQVAILEGYKRFLKQCDFDMQIIVLAYKSDAQKHIQNVKKYSCADSHLEAMAQNYINLIEKITSNKQSITRKFFIAIKSDKNIEYNISKIENGLSALGNEIIRCTKPQIEEILKTYYSQNTFAGSEVCYE